MKELSKNVLENQKDKDNKVNFIPERFEKILTKSALQNLSIELTFFYLVES